VNGISGGNSMLGTISNTGLYTAPRTCRAPLLSQSSPRARRMVQRVATQF
jgi:hypothetical protein